MLQCCTKDDLSQKPVLTIYRRFMLEYGAWQNWSPRNEVMYFLHDDSRTCPPHRPTHPCREPTRNALALALVSRSTSCLRMMMWSSLLSTIFLRLSSRSSSTWYVCRCCLLLCSRVFLLQHARRRMEQETAERSICSNDRRTRSSRTWSLGAGRPLLKSQQQYSPTGGPRYRCQCQSVSCGLPARLCGALGKHVLDSS